MNEHFEFELNCKKADLNRLGIDPKSVKCRSCASDSEKILVFGEHERLSDSEYLFNPVFAEGSKC